MKIKVEPYLMKRGNMVAAAAIEFSENELLFGFHLVGFTICEDDNKELFVLFPSSKDGDKRYFFLRGNEKLVEKLEHSILDVYEDMTKEKV